MKSYPTLPRITQTDFPFSTIPHPVNGFAEEIRYVMKKVKVRRNYLSALHFYTEISGSNLARFPKIFSSKKPKELTN